jgi:hypothetical protein
LTIGHPADVVHLVFELRIAVKFLENFATRHVCGVGVVAAVFVPVA